MCNRVTDVFIKQALGEFITRALSRMQSIVSRHVSDKHFIQFGADYRLNSETVFHIFDTKQLELM